MRTSLLNALYSRSPKFQGLWNSVCGGNGDGGGGGGGVYYGCWWGETEWGEGHKWREKPGGHRAVF